MICTPFSRHGEKTALRGKSEQVISVFNRGHFVFAPLRAFGVVIVYVIINERFQFIERLTASVIDIVLQMPKERFDGRIIDAVSLPGH